MPGSPTLALLALTPSLCSPLTCLPLPPWPPSCLPACPPARLPACLQLYKYDPETFSTWCAILRRVPDSVLWLLRFPPYGEARIKAEAAARGVDPARVIFTDVAAKPQHIRRRWEGGVDRGWGGRWCWHCGRGQAQGFQRGCLLAALCPDRFRCHLRSLPPLRCPLLFPLPSSPCSGVADLFLDTPWCNAHTTGCDVLWGGCPMVTLPLERFASRVAASLCNATGLGAEMVVGSQQEYEDRVRRCVVLGGLLAVASSGAAGSRVAALFALLQLAYLLTAPPSSPAHPGRRRSSLGWTTRRGCRCGGACRLRASPAACLTPRAGCVAMSAPCCACGSFTARGAAPQTLKWSRRGHRSLQQRQRRRQGRLSQRWRVQAPGPALEATAAKLEPLLRQLQMPTQRQQI